jgi:hypothetical protein
LAKKIKLSNLFSSVVGSKILLSPFELFAFEIFSIALLVITVGQKLFADFDDKLGSFVHVCSFAMPVTLGQISLTKFTETGQNGSSTLPWPLFHQTIDFLK